jgi:uncharacterized protein (TIGR02271 family)
MLVHSTNGIVGIVEDIQDEAGAGNPTLLIRGNDPDRYYRVPIALVRRVRQESGNQIIVLDSGTQALERYVTAAPAAKGRVAASAVENSASQEWRPETTDDVLRIPVIEEELSVETRPVSLGTVHIHQRVEARDQQMVVPTVHEEVVIEHLSADSYDPATPEDPDVVVIPVEEEQLVVTKRRVVTEYIRISKKRIEAQQLVRDTVRRTVVDIDDQTVQGAGLVNYQTETGTQAANGPNRT